MGCLRQTACLQSISCRIDLRVVAGASQRCCKRDIPAAGTVYSDDHAHDPDKESIWSRRRADRGTLERYLTFCSDRVCGFVGLLYLVELTRVDNALLYRDCRAQGPAGEAISRSLAHHSDGLNRVFRVCAVVDTAVQRLYRLCGLRPGYSQPESVQGL